MHWGLKLLIGSVVGATIYGAYTFAGETVKKLGGNAEQNAAILSKLNSIDSGVTQLGHQVGAHAVRIERVEQGLAAALSVQATLSSHAARIERVEQGLAAAIAARETILVDYRRFQDQVLLALREAAEERKLMTRELSGLAGKVEELRRGR